MITSVTFLYAALALLGGFIGARLTGVKPSSGVYPAGAGFLASVAAQLNGAAEAMAFLAFLIVTIAVGRLFKLRLIQIAGIVAAIVGVSVAGGFLIAFVAGFDDGIMKVLNHSIKR